MDTKKFKDRDFIITSRDVLSSTASCIIRQSPYPSVSNLVEILEDVRQYLISIGFPDELGFTDKYNSSMYIKKTYDEVLEICDSLKDIPSIDKLNLTKNEIDNGIVSSSDPNRKIKFVVCGRGISNNRDFDFIDLDALIRNIAGNLLYEE